MPQNSNAGISWIPWSFNYPLLLLLFDTVRLTVPLIWFALTSYDLFFLMIFFLEGREKIYPNMISGPVQRRYWTVVIHTLWRDQLWKKVLFSQDLQAPEDSEATQFFIVFLGNSFLSSPIILINQGKKLKKKDFPTDLSILSPHAQKTSWWLPIQNASAPKETFFRTLWIIAARRLIKSP